MARAECGSVTIRKKGGDTIEVAPFTWRYGKEDEDSAEAIQFYEEDC